MRKVLAKTIKLIFLVLCSVVRQIIAQKNKIIICPQNARNLAGNSYHLFLFLQNSTEHDFEFYVLIKNRKVFQQLKSVYGKRILYSYSIKGIYHFCSASFITISHGIQDYYPYSAHKLNKIIINIWHGIALKNIGVLANNYSGIEETQRLSEATSAFILSSEEEKEIVSQSLLLPEYKIYVTGLPKNDYLVQNKSIKRDTSLFTILYAPTFRDNSHTRIFPFDDWDLSKMTPFLERHNAEILIRHHINETDLDAQQIFSDRIRKAHAADFPDPQELLLQSDLVITDYSGIFIDFLLLDRPVMFFPYDLQDYEGARSLAYAYNESTPGPKVHSMQEFHEQLEQIIGGEDNYKKERATVRNRFHLHQDGGANQKVLDLMLSLNK